MRPATLRALLLLVTLAPFGTVTLCPRASACPFCDGGPSGVNEVKAGIFDDNFWPRVAATVAPFPVLAGIVALIYFGPPTLRWPRRAPEPSGVQHHEVRQETAR